MMSNNELAILAEVCDFAEKQHINKSKLAKKIKVSRTTVYNTIKKMKELNNAKK